MSPKHILVVDDSAFARRTLRRVLEENGFLVSEAAGGGQALTEYQSNRPDVVLMDIVMNEMGGFEALAKLKRLDPASKVIMATADLQEVTKSEALAAGAFGLVNKPFKPDELVASIRAALAD